MKYHPNGLVDIRRVIQWKIVNHFILATVLQRIGRAARRIEIQEVAVVFVESKHIFPEDMTHAKEKYSFTCLPMAEGEKNATEKIVSSMYKDNMQIRREGDLSAFHKVDLLLLWFLNTISCRRRLVLACFTDDAAYGRLAPDISCYDNYLYSSYESANAEEDSGVPEWELHDVTIRHFLRYLETNDRRRHQKNITIAKEIRGIHGNFFELRISGFQALATPGAYKSCRNHRRTPGSWKISTGLKRRIFQDMRRGYPFAL